MYESHFGFTGSPFRLNPDPAFLFASRGHSNAPAYLKFGIYQSERFVVVTGKIGAGKTTLVRTLLAELESEKIVAARIVGTQLEAGDLLRSVALAFGITTTSLSKAELIATIEAFLTHLLTQDRRALLIVDEAQNLSHEAAEELGMLSNFQLGNQALLQSFLVGPPELRRLLVSKPMEQLRQRVIDSCHLGPMDQAETRGYVEHRLRQVAWKGEPSFDDASFARIFRGSDGSPRRVNLRRARSFGDESRSGLPVRGRDRRTELRTTEGVGQAEREHGPCRPQGRRSHRRRRCHARRRRPYARLFAADRRQHHRRKEPQARRNPRVRVDRLSRRHGRRLHPLIEQHSGFQWKRDFYVVYSPERIKPGDEVHTLTTIVKVVSGDRPATLDLVAEMYGSIINAGGHRVGSIKVAEAAKLIENTRRDINIALINELSLIFHRIGIDTTEVLEAAGTKWNFLPHRPGLVGGHCIGVDPYYLRHQAETLGYHRQVILAGRRINDAMGKYIAEQTVKCMINAGQKVKGGSAIVLGLTFKENCPDLRNSKVIDVIHELQSYGLAVHAHDPVAAPAEARHEYGGDLVDWDDLPRAGAIVAAVSHRALVERPIDHVFDKLVEGRVYADVKSAADAKSLQARGAKAWRL